MSLLGKRKHDFVDDRPMKTKLRPSPTAKKVKSLYKKSVKPPNLGNLPEYKFCDTAYNSTAVSGTGSVSLVQSIAQGTDYTDRIGRKITIKAVQYDVAFDASPVQATLQAGFRQCRFMLVWDKQPNSALAGSGDILEQTGNASAPFSQKDVSNIDRFTILADESFCLSYGDKWADYAKRFVRCKLESRYDGTGATIADIASGAMMILYLDNNNSGANFTVFTGRVRVYFSDD